MKKLCCFLALMCLFTTQLALAEGNALKDLYEGSGLTLNEHQDSLVAMWGEMQNELGVLADGEGFTPGTWLMRMINAQGEADKIASRFDMPEDDWEKLWFMLTQGLAQYELNGKLSLAGDESIPGGMDATVALDAGMDYDECFVMDGRVDAAVDNGDGTGDAEGDDMFMRWNQQTGERRIKLPFMDESDLNASQADQVWQQRLMNSMKENSAEWALMIDTLYEAICNQPELRPLVLYLFEGAPQPEDYALTTKGLLRACDRLLKDLAVNTGFIEAMSKTVVCDMLLEQMSYTGDLDANQRKLMMTGLLSAVAVSMDATDTSSMPTIELRISGGRVTFSSISGQSSYGGFDDKIDCSYQPLVGGGFELRSSRATDDGNNAWQFGWMRRADHENHLSLTVRDRYETLGVITLDTDAGGCRFAFADSPESSYATYANVELSLTGADSYEISGLAVGSDVQLALSGGGNSQHGELQLSWADSSVPNVMLPIGSVSYTLQDGYISFDCALDDSPTGASNPFTANYTHQLSWTDNTVNLYARAQAQGEGVSFSLIADDRLGHWTGSTELYAIEWDEAQKVLDGSFDAQDNSLTAELRVYAEADAPYIPVEFKADWTDSALNAHAYTMGSALDANLDIDPNHLILNLIGDMAGTKAGIECMSVVQDGVRHTSVTAYDADGVPSGFMLDSKIDILDDGCAYDLKLHADAAGDVVDVMLVGEDHYVLDMSKSDPFTLNQAGELTATMDGSTISGSYDMNHRVYGGERKHREPKLPVRISENFEAPQPAAEPIPTEDDEVDEVQDVEPDEEPQPTLKPVKSFK